MDKKEDSVQSLIARKRQRRYSWRLLILPTTFVSSVGLFSRVWKIELLNDNRLTRDRYRSISGNQILKSCQKFIDIALNFRMLGSFEAFEAPALPYDMHYESSSFLSASVRQSPTFFPQTNLEHTSTHHAFLLFLAAVTTNTTRYSSSNHQTYTTSQYTQQSTT